MNVDEAFFEMKKRGWGFVWMGDTIGIGPITNPDDVAKGSSPLINVLAVDKDQVLALEKAIESVREADNR